MKTGMQLVAVMMMAVFLVHRWSRAATLPVSPRNRSRSSFTQERVAGATSFRGRWLLRMTRKSIYPSRS